MLRRRSNVIALSVVGLALVGLAAFLLLFVMPGRIGGRPTLIYFRLST